MCITSQRSQKGSKVGVFEFLCSCQIVLCRWTLWCVGLCVPDHHNGAVVGQGLRVPRFHIELPEKAVFLVSGCERHRHPTLSPSRRLLQGRQVHCKPSHVHWKLSVWDPAVIEANNFAVAHNRWREASLCDETDGEEGKSVGESQLWEKPQVVGVVVVGKVDHASLFTVIQHPAHSKVPSQQI